MRSLEVHVGGRANLQNPRFGTCKNTRRGTVSITRELRMARQKSAVNAYLRVALDHADEVAAAAEDGWDGGSVGSHFAWVVPVNGGGKSSTCVRKAVSRQRGWCCGSRKGRTTNSGGV